MLCTTFSCSSSNALTVTLVRVAERRAAASHNARPTRGSRLAWRLVRGALRLTPPRSDADGCDPPGSLGAASRSVDVNAEWPAYSSPRGRLLFRRGWAAWTC